jgi:hypothetical protein
VASRPSGTFCYIEIQNFTATLNVNNSVIFQLRTLPKVANERYYNIFLIFAVVWGKGAATQRVLKKFSDNKNWRKLPFFTSNSKAKKEDKKLAKKILVKSQVVAIALLFH